jgi:hypothetical protein
MRARYAAYAVAAVVGGPASASAADVTVDHECYAQKGMMVVSGSGYTPNSTVTITVGGATSSTTTDETGGLSATLKAPPTGLKHPGARQFVLSVHDVSSGADANTTINVARLGVDGVPSRSKPHKRVTWNIAGFPNQKAMYGHWRFGGKTRGNHRMGVPQGPCGVLHVKARLLEAKRIRYGTWMVQFDFNRVYDKHAVPAVGTKITIRRKFV